MIRTVKFNRQVHYAALVGLYVICYVDQDGLKLPEIGLTPEKWD